MRYLTKFYKNLFSFIVIYYYILIYCDLPIIASHPISISPLLFNIGVWDINCLPIELGSIGKYRITETVDR